MVVCTKSDNNVLYIPIQGVDVKEIIQKKITYAMIFSEMFIFENHLFFVHARGKSEQIMI